MSSFTGTPGVQPLLVLSASYIAIMKFRRGLLSILSLSYISSVLQIVDNNRIVSCQLYVNNKNLKNSTIQQG